MKLLFLTLEENKRQLGSRFSLVCLPSDDPDDDGQDDDADDGQDELLLPRLGLVALGLAKLLGSLLNPDVRGLDVLLDGVDHLALFVDEGRQVFEDGVDVDDVRLQLADGPLTLSKVLDVLLLLKQQLRLALAASAALFHIDLDARTQTYHFCATGCEM